MLIGLLHSGNCNVFNVFYLMSKYKDESRLIYFDRDALKDVSEEFQGIIDTTQVIAIFHMNTDTSSWLSLKRQVVEYVRENKYALIEEWSRNANKASPH
jgi:hypothetical protein